MMTSTTEALQDTIRALEQRMSELERKYHRLKMTEAAILRIQPNDIIVINTPRPIATSEQAEIVKAWQQLMARHNLHNELLLICGEKVAVEVMRGTAS